MSTERDLGKLEAEVAGLKHDVGELTSEVKTLVAFFNQARGGWKTVLLVAGVAGAAGALVSKLAGWLALVKPG